MTRASDLLDGLRARLVAQGLVAEVESDPLLLACNAFEIVALLSALAAEIGRPDPVTQFLLLVREDGPGALIRLEWKGGPMALAALNRRLALPIDPDLEGRTGMAILAAHSTDIWPEHSGDTAALCLPIPRARRAVRRPKPINRSVVFDFDL
jgi:DNA polymerase-3 subunit epsilon